MARQVIFKVLVRQIESLLIDYIELIEKIYTTPFSTEIENIQAILTRLLSMANRSQPNHQDFFELIAYIDRVKLILSKNTSTHSSLEKLQAQMDTMTNQEPLLTYKDSQRMRESFDAAILPWLEGNRGVEDLYSFFKKRDNKKPTLSIIPFS